MAVDWAKEIADQRLAEETARRLEAARQAGEDAEKARAKAEAQR
ncbi:hypothetical protein [Streptomyces cinereoruber]